MQRTAKEVKENHIESMGEELGLVYHLLWNELAWLNSKWAEYVELFGKKSSRIELQNKISGHFFRVVQDCLWENTLLHIARLTDPVKTAGKNNLTIRKLIELTNNDSLKINLSERIDFAIEKTEFCRDWRNRHIAHRDLSLAITSVAEPLKPASRYQVKEALESLSDVLNVLSLHYMDSTTIYNQISGPNGSVSLLYALDDSLKYQKEKNERIERGEIRNEDFQIRDL